MIYIIILEYSINIILMILYHLHMFQLNSYFIKKHFRWIKKNIINILAQLILIILSIIIYYSNFKFNAMVSSLLLAVSIIYTIPKKKSKIPLNMTNRAKRLIVTELIISIIIINDINYYIFLKLGIINAIVSVLIIIANIINYPIEKLIR